MRRSKIRQWTGDLRGGVKSVSRAFLDFEAFLACSEISVVPPCKTTTYTMPTDKEGWKLPGRYCFEHNAALL